MFITRLLPFIRAAFPYAAGVARMSYWRCMTAATLGSIIWIGGLGLLGREVGSQWQTWRHHLEYVDYVGVVVLVAAIVYLIVRRTRSRPSEPGAGETGHRGRCRPRLTRLRSPPRRVCDGPWRSVRCTGRRSFCRSPPRAISR